MGAVLRRDNVVDRFGPRTPPATTIDPGATLRLETTWPVGLGMRSVDDPRPARRITMTGPIAVRGARPGDALRVAIRQIVLPDWGMVWTAPWLGLLAEVALYERRIPIRDGRVEFAPGFRWPVRPMVGFIGVAPAEGDMDCLAPGEHGGNMDTLTVTTGSTVVLPVLAPEALLAVGDVHASMGEGEVIGISLEVGAELTLTVDLAPGAAPPCALVETPAHVAVVISEHDFQAASLRAVRVMTELLAQRRGLAFEEAYAVVGLLGDLRISQNVNPYGITLRLEIPRQVWEGSGVSGES